MKNSEHLQKLAVPHNHVLAMPEDSIEKLSIEEKMQMVQDIRNFIGQKKDEWHAQGWDDEAIPPDQHKIFRQAEDIGLKLYAGMGISAEYWKKSTIELEVALKRISNDPEIQAAAHHWPDIPRDEQQGILQKAVYIMAEEQTKQAGIGILPGTVRWVEDAPFEGNSSADYKESPKTYAIELNSDEDIEFITNFDRAIKCALHEQTHVKQSNYAHSYYVGTLPSAFNDVARYLVRQPDAYVPAWRSDRLNAAQPCEKEALMATQNTQNLCIFPICYS